MPSLAESSLSSERDSSEQRLYCCFCERLFATYPGIYQHLKAKHLPLFPTYKKRTLKKMLRKSRDLTGTIIYRLVKLPESLVNSLTLAYQKKTAQKVLSKATKSQPHSPCLKALQAEKLPLTASGKQKDELENPLQQIKSKHHADSASNPKNLSWQDISYEAERPQFPGLYLHSPPPYAFPFYPPFNPDYWFTVKALLLRFLHQAVDFDKELTRGYLYEFMVFIDKNYKKANDPRTQGRLFLSYCDEFDPRYLGPLMSSYIQNLEGELQQKSKLSHEQQEQQTVLQIDSVKTFALWLQQANLLKLSSELPLGQQQNQELKEVFKKIPVEQSVCNN